ncbi:MAG: IS3 family transposase [Ignavibacteria bacterium]|nr:IS3 family transposase [Ignavibacteria bacterium]
MRYRFMDTHRAQWPLAAMSRALEVSRQGYHAWKRREPSRRTIRHATVRLRLKRIFEQTNGSYGSPRMTRVLRKEGEILTHKTVERLMRAESLHASRKRRYRPTTDSTRTLGPAPNLLQRAFNVPVIDRVWVSDFTELPCRNGKAYAVAIMDLCSRRILGITVSHNMQTRTLIHTLNQACHVRRSRPTEPIVFHSDQGSQYNADTFRTELAKRNFQQSMSGRGNCYDNAPMESFWARMKTELKHEMLFDDLRHARGCVYRWTHLFYNRQRLHSGINHLTPVQFEEELISQQRDQPTCL